MSSLNPQQNAAVAEIKRPLLVVAGAGSGKTRVITEKIAHLIRQGLPARQITAVTFTNKAAREMKSRVGSLLKDQDSRGLRISTFHALGLEIVRKHHQAIGYKSGLTLFDEQDRNSLIKDLIQHHFPKWDAAHSDRCRQQISRWKNQFVLPNGPESREDAGFEGAGVLYSLYVEQMRAYNALDFDDLILKPVLAFTQHPDVLETWQNKIRYLLVDEYQDTNEAQYQLLRQLIGKTGRFTVVGDDDQSIYSWRGAQPENIIRIKDDFPRLSVIKLEQNYRSSQRILHAANTLIANNPHTIEKKLWSALNQGEKIQVLHHKDEVHEARQIASDLVHHKFRSAGHYGDYAILYRSNHQARVFETALRENGIPYSITGGTSFFSAAEIKDLMAYIRLIVNPDDDGAFLRIANVPRREIGPTTLEKVGAYANQRHIALFRATGEMGLLSQVTPQTQKRLLEFTRLIEEAKSRAEGVNPLDAVEALLGQIDYEGWIRETAPSPESARNRLEKVAELLAWLRKMAEDRSDSEPPTLADLVNKVMLIDVLERQEDDEKGDRVSLMTLHASKGLEFPYVYLAGVEENLLPHEASIDSRAIEEERRLAYVGITRAQKRITLSYCTHRKRRGELESRQPSRFLEELPSDDLEWSARKSLDPETLKTRGQASINQLRDLLKPP